MIGQYAVGLTLLVNIAMRWPSLVPAALIIAMATALYGEQDREADLALVRRAAEIGWQVTQGNSPLAGSRGPSSVLTVGEHRSMAAGAALTEASVSAAESRHVDGASRVPE